MIQQRIQWLTHPHLTHLMTHHHLESYILHRFNYNVIVQRLSVHNWRPLLGLIQHWAHSLNGEKYSLCIRVPVNTQKRFTTSSTPLHGSFVHFPTIFLLKILKWVTSSLCPLLTPKKCSLPYLPHYMAHLSIFLPYFPWKPWKSH